MTRVSTPSPSMLRREVRDRLAAAGIESADAEATLIVAEVLEVQPARLVMSADANPAQVARVEALTARRVRREPLQHVLGWAGFRRLTVDVGPGVFVPRPETEILVDECLAALGANEPEAHVAAELNHPRAIAVDLCSGSGAIALALADEFPGLRAYAVEAATPALPWLQRNISKWSERLAKRGAEVIAVHADACSNPLAELAGTVDLVASNPPYIPADCVPRDPEVANFDPPTALYGGSDGLEVVRCLTVTAARLLRAGGTLAVEHGDEQGEDHRTAGVPGVLRASGWFVDVHDVADLNGRPRVTVARRA